MVGPPPPPPPPPPKTHDHATAAFESGSPPHQNLRTILNYYTDCKTVVQVIFTVSFTADEGLCYSLLMIHSMLLAMGN